MWFSSRSKREIECRDATDTKKILCTFCVAPHSPVGLFAESSSVLAYADLSKVENLMMSNSATIDIYRLNLTGTIPKVSNKRPDSFFKFHDICFVEHEDKKLMIVAGGETLFAKNTLTGNTEWMVKGRLPGRVETMLAWRITTDGRGNLYVCDYRKDNRSIHVFSVSEGFYLGCLIKEGEQGIGVPISVHWSIVLSSLLVVHYKNDHQYLNSLINEPAQF